MHFRRLYLSAAILCVGILFGPAHVASAQSFNSGNSGFGPSFQNNGFQGQSTQGQVGTSRTGYLSGRKSTLETRRGFGNSNTDTFVGRNQNRSGNSNRSQANSRRRSRSGRDRRDRGSRRDRRGDNGSLNTQDNNAGTGLPARRIRPRLQLGTNFRSRQLVDVNTTLSSRMDGLQQRFAAERLRRPLATRNSNVNIDNFDQETGTVTLRGKVSSLEQRRFWEAVVRMEPGVRKVANELELEEDDVQ